jgi:tyrosyl-tRNA synthetase|tara:strand:- start:400 stop:1371 length:972 start_codon:yes stop_codon:yes gene_type:complete
MVMKVDKRIELIKRNSDEILNEKYLKEILKKKNLTVYCGYEPTGEIHLGHLVTITKLLDFQKAGIKPIVLLADWHAWLNKKGDWNFLEKQIKIWSKGMKAAGLTKAKFVKGTNFQRKDNYLDDVMIMALNTTVNRGIRSMQTVARDIENAKISQIIYPLMQIEDIKSLNVDFVISGMDQRKIHALGLEVFSKIDMKKKPVFIHTGIITSLKGPGKKMSSSSPETIISIRDSKETINKKINNAHCIEGEIKNNPILEICKLLIFPRFEKIKIKRSSKYGGDLSYNSYFKLEKDFESKKLHPLDLKNSVSEYLRKIIEPIRKVWK